MLRRLAFPTFAAGLVAVLVKCGAASSTNGPNAGGDSSAKDGSSNADAAGATEDATAVVGGGTDATVQDSGGGAPDTGAPEAGAASPSVTQFHAHLNRDGFYIDPAFSKAALNGGMVHLDTTFKGTGVVGEVRASPLYVQKGVGGSGTFYVETESDNVYAFSESTGSMLWNKNFGVGLTTEPCGQNHTVGIRGTPAIDTGTGLMVFDAATGTGSTIAKHTIYGISITTGATQWSVDTSTLMYAGVGGFDPTDQNQRSAVLIVGGIAYVAYGGFYGDCGGYHGWVIGVPLSGTGAKAYATPGNESGFWAVGGLSSDGTNLYAATGNGTVATGGAFSLLRFTAGPTFSGSTNDYWYAMGDTGDEDLGGSGPLLVQPAGGNPLVVQLGKDGNGYLLDTTKPLGGMSSPTGMAKLMDDEITTGPASATITSGTEPASATYVVMQGNNAGTGGHACPVGMSGELVTVTISAANAFTTAWCADPMGGGSPIITTTDGNSDALVWVSGTPGNNERGAGSNQLHAWDLASGALIVTGSDPFTNVHHFTSPIVVNGRIFVAGDTQLYAYTP